MYTNVQMIFSQDILKKILVLTDIGFALLRTSWILMKYMKLWPSDQIKNNSDRDCVSEPYNQAYEKKTMMK